MNLEELLKMLNSQEFSHVIQVRRVEYSNSGNIKEGVLGYINGIVYQESTKILYLNVVQETRNLSVKELIKGINKMTKNSKYSVNKVYLSVHNSDNELCAAPIQTAYFFNGRDDYEIHILKFIPSEE